LAYATRHGRTLCNPVSVLVSGHGNDELHSDLSCQSVPRAGGSARDAPPEQCLRGAPAGRTPARRARIGRFCLGWSRECRIHGQQLQWPASRCFPVSSPRNQDPRPSTSVKLEHHPPTSPQGRGLVSLPLRQRARGAPVVPAPD
jgi:hypothetical protein